MVEGAIGAGARDVAIGRNVFQHESPVLIVRRICAVVHQDLSAKEAMEMASAK
jgi:DhnA family fructose-bisphosphate aldolase class Ia